MDSGGVGDVAAADGDLERAVQLGEPAGEIAGATPWRHRGCGGHVLRRPAIVRRRATATASAARSAACCRTVDALEGIGAGGQHASAGSGRQFGGDQPDRLLVGIEGIVIAAALQQAPPAPLVEDGRPGAIVSRIEVGERIGDQLRRPIEISCSAGDVGRPIDDLGAGHRQVGARTVAIVVHRRQQPVVVALRLGQGVGQLGVDRRGEGGGDGPVVAPGARPVVDEGGGPPRTDEGVVEVDGPGVGGVQARSLAREQLVEHRLVDEGVTKRIPLLVDQQQVMLPGRPQPCVEDVGREPRQPLPADGGRLYGRRWRRHGRSAGTLLSRRSRRASSSSWSTGGMSLSPDTAANSSAKNGLPSDRSSTALTNQSGGWAPRMPRSCSATSAGPNGRQAQVVDAVGPLEFGEQPAHRIAALEIVGAVRRHQQHAGKLRAAGENGEQVAGRSVGPVDVLDDQHHGPLAGQPAQSRWQRLRRSSALAGPGSPSWSSTSCTGA